MLNCKKIVFGAMVLLVHLTSLEVYAKSYDFKKAAVALSNKDILNCIAVGVNYEESGKAWENSKIEEMGQTLLFLYREIGEKKFGGASGYSEFLNNEVNVRLATNYAKNLMKKNPDQINKMWWKCIEQAKF